MVDRQALAGVIDHTNLYPDAREGGIDQLCHEAAKYGFAGVCVYSGDVPHVTRVLADQGVDCRVSAVAGFPHGRSPSTLKAEEAAYAVENGADEIDVVINQGLVRDGFLDRAIADLQEVRTAVPDAVLKVICENCNLSREEKLRAYRVAAAAGADFIKTSTGFGEYGAREEDVALMREFAEDISRDIGIKASGGIGDAETALRMWKASGKKLDPDAFRIGASRGVQIVDSMEGDR